MRLTSADLRLWKWMDLSRLHEHDRIGVLHFAFDHKKGFFRDHQAQALE
jgi:hypothetical protein